jgi:biopolymer transport protein ExbD
VCTKDSGDLKTWLSTLAAEGRADFGSILTLAAVPAPPVKFDVPQTAHIVEIAADISVDSRFVSSSTPVHLDQVRDAFSLLTRTRNPADSTSITPHGALTDQRPGQYIVVVDQKAQWSAVAAVVDAIRDTGGRRVDFVFRASRSALAMPGSSLVAPERVFAHCPDILAWLPTLSTETAAAKDRRVASELPGLVADCKCNVELPAVRRLMWAWWNRDHVNAPLLLATLTIDPTGTVITGSEHAEWSEMAPKVFEAIQRGQSVRVDVR